MPKPAVLQIDKHASSSVDIENEGAGSSSLGLETSQKSKICSLGKEKIEALKGLGIGSSVGRAGNLSGSKSKPNSAMSLSSTKRKSSNATYLKNQVEGEVYLVILPPFNSFFFSFFSFLFLFSFKG